MGIQSPGWPRTETRQKQNKLEDEADLFFLLLFVYRYIASVLASTVSLARIFSFDFSIAKKQATTRLH